MVLRKCPKCGTTTDDIYGFCIKCGYEFPKIEKDGSTCPLCGFSNPDEADFCVKCGTPLIFKSQFDKNHDNLNPIIIKKEKEREEILSIYYCLVDVMHSCRNDSMSGGSGRREQFSGKR